MIYHIATQDDWKAANISGTYWPTTKPKEEFIHFSFSHQLGKVANRFFHGRSDVTLLCLDSNVVKDALKIEAVPGEAESNPHVYRPILITEVTKVLDIKPGNDGKFSLSALL